MFGYIYLLCVLDVENLCIRSYFDLLWSTLKGSGSLECNKDKKETRSKRGFWLNKEIDNAHFDTPSWGDLDYW